jgi:26S proteasome regulatory subunit N9
MILIDIDESIEFLKQLEDKVKDSIGASLFLKVSIAEKRLALGQYNECFDLLTEVEGQLRAQNDVDQIVYSENYKTLAMYYRRKEKYTEFYQNGLQFLAYTPSDELSEQEKHEWCINMGKAILLGKDIYNIAELLEKDILKSLINTDYEWLYEILKALNTANIEEFEDCLVRYHAQITLNEDIAKNEAQLQKKIRILAFLDLIFHRDKGDRNLDFQLIADTTKMGVEEIEFLVMKAMSLGLVKGVIDQVDQIVRISWVKPRLLAKDKIKIMSEKLARWDQQIKDTLTLLTNGSE